MVDDPRTVIIAAWRVYSTWLRTGKDPLPHELNVQMVDLGLQLHRYDNKRQIREKVRKN